MKNFNLFVNRHPYITLTLGIALMAIVIASDVCATPAPTTSTAPTFKERITVDAPEDGDEILAEMAKIMESKAKASFATASSNHKLTAEEVAKAYLFGDTIGKVYLELLQDPVLDDRAASTLGAVVGTYTFLDDPIAKFSAAKNFEVLLLFALGDEAAQKMAAATTKALEEAADPAAAMEAALWRISVSRAQLDLECLVADRAMYYILKSL